MANLTMYRCPICDTTRRMRESDFCYCREPATQMVAQWTLKAAQARVRELGFNLSNTGDDYRLCPRGESEKSAYYSDDLDDIVRSAINWR